MRCLSVLRVRLPYLTFCPYPDDVFSMPKSRLEEPQASMQISQRREVRYSANFHEGVIFPSERSRVMAVRAQSRRYITDSVTRAIALTRRRGCRTSPKTSYSSTTRLEAWISREQLCNSQFGALDHGGNIWTSWTSAYSNSVVQRRLYTHVVAYCRKYNMVIQTEKVVRYVRYRG